MSSVLDPFQFVVIAIAEWMNQHQQQVVLRQNFIRLKAIDYLTRSLHTPAHDRDTSMAS
jgi:hypothetical protein